MKLNDFLFWVLFGPFLLIIGLAMLAVLILVWIDSTWLDRATMIWAFIMLATGWYLITENNNGR